jgi:molybdate transport system ATP-binding protein
MAAHAPSPTGTHADHEFLCFDGVTLPGRPARAPRLHWLWRRGEQWAVLGSEGTVASELMRALRGEVPVAAGEIRGPHGPLDQPELGPEEAVGLVSPETQRQVVLAEASFYQSRWHSGLGEGQRTVGSFLSQASVEQQNPFQVDASLRNAREFQCLRRRLVEQLGIRPLWRRRLAHLSNGEMRKTLLVYALLRRPWLLILEHPYAGLDAGTRQHLRRTIHELMTGGMPVLVITHRVDEIPRDATHLLVLDGKRVLGLGPKGPMLRRWQRREPGTGDKRAGMSPEQLSARFPQAAGAEPIIELRAVTILGGRRRILDKVTWTVRTGEHWLVLGRNGAGKTTLLNLIQGDHPQAYSQSIRLFGRSTDSTQTLWQVRQRLGWMSPELHQHYPLEWQVKDVVASGFFNSVGLYQAPSRRQRTGVNQWLRRLGLPACVPFGSLSFGEQRLVLVARAVVKGPGLLILDEPCQSLDSRYRRTLMEAVDEVVAEQGCTLIYVTHHPRELPRCVTHVLRLERGRVQQAGPVAL